MNDFVEKLEALYNAEDRFTLEEAAKDAKRAAEKVVNYFGYSCKAIVEEIKSSPKVAEIADAIALQWVHFWSSEGKYPGWENERNTLAIRMCGEIRYYAQDILDRMETDRDMFGRTWHNASYFIQESVRMHRTLMQSFSSVLFYLLTQDAAYGHELNKRMSEVYGRTWYGTN